MCSASDTAMHENQAVRIRTRDRAVRTSSELRLDPACPQKAPPPNRLKQYKTGTHDQAHPHPCRTRNQQGKQEQHQCDSRSNQPSVFPNISLKEFHSTTDRARLGRSNVGKYVAVRTPQSPSHLIAHLIRALNRSGLGIVISRVRD